MLPMKPADALVEVVRAAQHGARRQRGDRRPAQLPEPAQQIADDDHLLQDGVLHARRGSAPGYFHHTSGSDSGTTVRLNAGRARRQVEGEPGAADRRRDHRAAAQVAAAAASGRSRWPAGRSPSRISRCATSATGTSAVAIPKSCQARSSQGRPGRVRAVEGGRLVLERPRFGHRSDKADQRGHPARTERQGQHEQRLVCAESVATAARSGKNRPPTPPPPAHPPPVASSRLIAHPAPLGSRKKVRRSCATGRRGTGAVRGVPPLSCLTAVRLGLDREGTTAMGRHSLPDRVTGRARPTPAHAHAAARWPSPTGARPRRGRRARSSRCAAVCSPSAAPAEDDAVRARGRRLARTSRPPCTPPPTGPATTTSPPTASCLDVKVTARAVVQGRRRARQGRQAARTSRCGSRIRALWVEPGRGGQRRDAGDRGRHHRLLPGRRSATVPRGREVAGLAGEDVHLDRADRAPPLQDDKLRLGAADPARSATGLLALTRLSAADGQGKGGDDTRAAAMAKAALPAHRRQRRAGPGHAAARLLRHRAGQSAAQPGAAPLRAGGVRAQHHGGRRRRTWTSSTPRTARRGSTTRTPWSTRHGEHRREPRRHPFHDAARRARRQRTLRAARASGTDDEQVSTARGRQGRRRGARSRIDADRRRTRRRRRRSRRPSACGRSPCRAPGSPRSWTPPRPWRSPVPGTGQSRMDVTKASLLQALAHLHPEDEIGLWKFATSLDGDKRLQGARRPPTASATARARRHPARQAVRGVQLPGAGAGRRDRPVRHHARRVQGRPPRPTRAGKFNALVVLTDGANQDPGSISRSSPGRRS